MASRYSSDCVRHCLCCRLLAFTNIWPFFPPISLIYRRIILSALGLSSLAFSYARRNHCVSFSSASSASYIQTLTLAEVGLGTFGGHQDMPVHHSLPVFTR